MQSSGHVCIGPEIRSDLQRDMEWVTSVVKLVIMSSIGVPMISVVRRGSFSNLWEEEEETYNHKPKIMLHHINFRLL